MREGRYDDMAIWILPNPTLKGALLFFGSGITFASLLV
jgi:hypothetical protein